MGLRRLAKDATSTSSGRCPALYATDDPTRMAAQVKVMSADEAAQLLEVGAGEVAGSIPTETVFRGIARYANEQGDAALAAALTAFLRERGM
jgi:hypothetical protein